MYRVKRLSLGEEMSSFLRVPKTGWVTSRSTKRVSWTINDLEGCRKNSVYIGVRYSLLGGLLYNFKGPTNIAVPAVEPGQEEVLMEALMDVTVVGPEEAFRNQREQVELSRLYTAFMTEIMRTRKVKGMTAEDLGTFMPRR